MSNQAVQKKTTKENEERGEGRGGKRENMEMEKRTGDRDRRKW